MEDLKRFTAAVQKRWGIRAIQIHIHRDEGHYEENERGRRIRVPNYHAHIVWDWMDHTTGKSHKLSEKDMSEMQDMLADMLKMERGQKKSETRLEHLEREDAVKAIMTHMENCLIAPKMPYLRLLRQGWCQRRGWRRWHQR